MPTTPDTDIPDQDFDADPMEDSPPPHSLAECVREAPLTALATAFIAGLVLGRLVL